MSTNTVQYGIISVNQFSKLMFSHTKGEPKIKIHKGMRISCDLSDKQEDPAKYDKCVSFAYDLNSK